LESTQCEELDIGVSGWVLPAAISPAPRPSGGLGPSLLEAVGWWRWEEAG